MGDATGLAEALLGLDGFRVLDVAKFPDELCISVETTADVAGCPSCGVRALAHERKRVDIRDLPPPRRACPRHPGMDPRRVRPFLFYRLRKVLTALYPNRCPSRVNIARKDPRL